jgi:hypothetical protein
VKGKKSILSLNIVPKNQQICFCELDDLFLDHGYTIGDHGILKGLLPIISGRRYGEQLRMLVAGNLPGRISRLIAFSFFEKKTGNEKKPPSFCSTENFSPDTMYLSQNYP